MSHTLLPTEPSAAVAANALAQPAAALAAAALAAPAAAALAEPAAVYRLPRDPHRGPILRPIPVPSAVSSASLRRSRLAPSRVIYSRDPPLPSTVCRDPHRSYRLPYSPAVLLPSAVYSASLP